MDMDWSNSLAGQLDWHWQNQFRPRLRGLTDDEYFWEPVPGCWSVRRRSAAKAPRTAAGGDWLYEFAYPEPDPPPVTTIAWRLAHLIVGVFGQRNASHFAGPPVSWDSFSYAGSAAGALAQLDEAYEIWINAVCRLGPEGLARPCGPAEGPFAEYPMAELVLHINREALHHGAEIALLRDLYRAKGADRRAL
jgi:DinB superfamily